MSEKLIIAVPSKGRLEEKTAEIFAAAGMKLNRAGTRGYAGTLAGIENVEIAYLSASEIAARLNEGAVHFGITGEDLLRENVPDLESNIQLVMPLGFGAADVVIAVPNGWADVTSMYDLADVAAEFRAKNNKPMRVATKYINLATDYLAKNNVQDVEIVMSDGATEGAPASGSAELIVDITSSGETLKANDLRILEDGVILQSQANLAAALTAVWSPQARQAARQILSRLSAYFAAQNMLEVKLTIPMGKYPNFTMWGLNITILHKTESGLDMFYHLLVEKDNLQALIDILAKWEIKVLVSKPDYYFAPRNELYDRLAGALE